MELTTEASNPDSIDLDRLDTLELVQLINAEDAKVAAAVGEAAAAIAAAIDVISTRLGSGGRLIYVGAGTSGRLGVLDAAECPPTFNADPEQVTGLIAGGPTALVNPVEGAEDSPELAVLASPRVDKHRMCWLRWITRDRSARQRLASPVIVARLSKNMPTS